MERDSEHPAAVGSAVKFIQLTPAQPDHFAQVRDDALRQIARAYALPSSVLSPMVQAMRRADALALTGSCDRGR